MVEGCHRSSVLHKTFAIHGHRATSVPVLTECGGKGPMVIEKWPAGLGSFMQSSNRVISKFALHVHVRQTLPACMRNIFKAILLVSLTTWTACWVNKNIGDMISKYTEAMYLLSKHQGMSNIEQLFVHCKPHWTDWNMGQVTKYPKKRNVDYWKWRGQLCFFSALEFGPLPNLDWSQPQMRSESLIWLCWCCLAHEKIAFGYPITTYGGFLK